MDTFTKEELYKTEVSYFSSRWANKPTNSKMKIEFVLSDIKNGFYSNPIEQIRHYKRCGNIDMSKRIKSRLPAVTFSGQFENKRTKECCTNYNSLIALDIDHIPDNDLPTIKGNLKQDQFVIALWLSPSGDGLKVLVPLSHCNVYNIDEDTYHKNAFEQIEKYYKNKYNIELDEKCNDITRLCFCSYDPEIIIKEQCNIFKVDINNENDKNYNSKKKHLYTECDLPRNYNKITIDWNHLNLGVRKPDTHNECRHTMDLIVKYLEKGKKSITYNNKQWYSVALAIASTFHHVYGRKMFLRLCRLDAEKHNEIKSEKVLFYAYTMNQEKYSFNTIVYYAEQKGWIVKLKDRNVVK